MNSTAEKQIQLTAQSISTIFGDSLISAYLYGSAVASKLQKYSDIDFLLVLESPTTTNEKQQIIEYLLNISGIYMQGGNHPIELTTVVLSDINPWVYPPKFDWQYGEWLREQFTQGEISPYTNKEMPDLALLITQAHLASKCLLGPPAQEILPVVPYRDVILAIQHALTDLIAEITTDTRNVLLTLARIWHTVETNVITSKPNAATWAIEHLNSYYSTAIRRARSICLGIEEEHWGDIMDVTQDCANYMCEKIKTRTVILLNNEDSLRNSTISIE